MDPVEAVEKCRSISLQTKASGLEHRDISHENTTKAQPVIRSDLRFCSSDDGCVFHHHTHDPQFYREQRSQPFD